MTAAPCYPADDGSLHLAMSDVDADGLMQYFMEG
jgi:hypothetical protein